MPDCIRFVFLSDTHGFHELEVPPGDVLVHAGDGCKRGSLEEAAAWGAFLASLPHARKIVIAGNHDRCFESDLDAARRSFPASVEFLHDSGCTIEDVSVWGSPWQPWFLSWAFNLQRGAEIAQKWALIPEATDLLITHGPPQGILDRTFDDRPVGCEELRATIFERVRPRIHAFGHIHEGYGVQSVDGTMFVNASTCTLSYQPTNPAIVVDLPRDRERPPVLVSGGRE